MYGGGKNDEVYGGFFRDRLFGGSGRDYVQGDSGADRINVAGDGINDSIDCGIGEDTAVVDEADIGQATVDEFFRLTSCENVIVR